MMKYVPPYILERIARQEERRRREIFERLSQLPLPMPLPPRQSEEIEDDPEDPGYIIFDMGG